MKSTYNIQKPEAEWDGLTLDEIRYARALTRARIDISKDLRDEQHPGSQKFTEALRQKGVTEIEVRGKEFDADLSEAVARFAAGDDKKGLVIDVVQTGYMLRDKVLRFAKVVVGE